MSLSLTINDRQKWNATHNPRSISRGHCGHGGAAVFSSCRCAVTSLKLGRGLRAPGPFRPHSIPGKPLSQSIAYLDRRHLNRLSSLPLRPDQHGRSDREWRYQIQVMRCPK